MPVNEPGSTERAAADAFRAPQLLGFLSSSFTFHPGFMFEAKYKPYSGAISTVTRSHFL